MKSLLALALALAALAAAPAIAELPQFDARAPAWSTLIILAVPADLWSDSLQGPDPAKVDRFYAENGPEWFENALAPELRDYLLRVTYGTIPLDIEVTPWLKLPRARTEASPFSYVEDRGEEARDAIREARRSYTLENYRTLIVLDPTSPGSGRFSGEWAQAWGKFYPRVAPGRDAIVAGVFHGGSAYERDPVTATVRILAHEVLHAVDFARDGQHDLHDNTGTNFCLHGPPQGGEPWLCPFNEAAVLGVGPRSAGAGSHVVKPVEEGPGQGVRARAGASDLFLEFRRTANPEVEGHEGPALLLWKVRGGEADLLEVFREPGRSIAAGLPVEVLSMGAAGAEVKLA